MKAATRSTLIVWQGPSAFTCEEVQVVLQGVTYPSTNEKTGPCVQASIVVAGENPSLLLGTERERACCGDCPLRGRGAKRVCYVAWHAWLLGQHLPRAGRATLAEAAELLRGRVVRLGAYGDPAAVPFGVWSRLLARSKGWLGYTHGWRTADPRFRRYLMASVESHPAAIEAELAGWRYFRIRHRGSPALRSEVVCPNETTGVRCIDCGLCAGTSRRAKNLCITVHGVGAERFVRIGRAA